jgi:hypothetical protein
MSIAAGDRLYVVGDPSKGMFGLLKEEMLESFIDQMNLQVETFRALKNKKEK